MTRSSCSICSGDERRKPEGLDDHVDDHVDVDVDVDVDHVDDHVVQVMSGANRRDWTPAFPDDHRHDGLKRDSRYYYPRNHLL